MGKRLNIKTSDCYHLV